MSHRKRDRRELVHWNNQSMKGQDHFQNAIVDIVFFYLEQHSALIKIFRNWHNVSIKIVQLHPG